jgi:hypothetical protein
VVFVIQSPGLLFQRYDRHICFSFIFINRFTKNDFI